jgi:hypothetical protein
MKHEEVNCSRCEGSFECKVGDIANCQCSTVKVSAETHEFLSKTHYGCLCKKCLEELNRAVKARGVYKFPASPELLVEDLHFYKEDGYFVFTEFYHILRGHCCGNGCRHCAYGFKKMVYKP